MNSLLWAGALAALGVLFHAPSAFADAGTIGGAINNVGENAVKIPDLISLVAYALGGMVMITACLKFKSHADNPNQTPLSAGMVRLLVSGSLMGLPIIAQNIINTLAVTGVLDDNALGVAQGAGGTVALDVLLQNFVSNIQGPLINIIDFVAYILGAWLVLKGLLKAIRYADDGPKGQPGMGIVALLTMGAALMATPGLLDQVSNTLTMGDPSSFSSLAFGNGNGATVDPAVQQRMNNAARSVFAFVQIIGLIGFVRGFNMLRMVGEGGNQQASMPAALTHIIGGAIAWNIVDFVHVLEKTLGINGLIIGA